MVLLILLVLLLAIPPGRNSYPDSEARFEDAVFLLDKKKKIRGYPGTHVYPGTWVPLNPGVHVYPVCTCLGAGTPGRFAIYRVPGYQVGIPRISSRYPRIPGYPIPGFLGLRQVLRG